MNSKGGVSFSATARSRQQEVSPRKCEERQSYSTPIPPHGRRWPIICMVSPDSEGIDHPLNLLDALFDLGGLLLEKVDIRRKQLDLDGGRRPHQISDQISSSGHLSKSSMVQDTTSSFAQSIAPQSVTTVRSRSRKGAMLVSAHPSAYASPSVVARKVTKEIALDDPWL